MYQIVSLVGVTGYRIGSPCRVVPWQDAPARGMAAYLWDGYAIYPTQILVWLLRNAGFLDLWCETELVSLQSLPQP